MRKIYRKGKCDYCGQNKVLTRPTPFLADMGAMMCKICWDITKEEYMASSGEHIPEFGKEDA